MRDFLQFYCRFVCLYFFEDFSIQLKKFKNMLNWKLNNEANSPNCPQQHQVKRINQYMFDLYDEIGRGYSSIVYKGKNLLTGQIVAIKAIELKKVTNEIEKKLLNNQIKALKSLNHCNVLKAIDVLQTSNNFYVVTKFYENSLEGLLKQRGRFTEKEILYFIEKMSEVLCYLEDKNIVHRDIKPSNIFVQNDQYVLGDFGFCSFRNPYLLHPQNVHYNVGSPLYMSPQSFRASIYSIKSDVWSLGMCIIELILGERPFSHITYDNMVKILQGEQFIQNLDTSEVIKKILKKIFFSDPYFRAYPSQILKTINNQSERCILGIESNKVLAEQLEGMNFKRSHVRKVSCGIPMKTNRVHCRKLSEKENTSSANSSRNNIQVSKNTISLSKDKKNITHAVSPHKTLTKNHSVDLLLTCRNSPQKICDPFTKILNELARQNISQQCPFTIKLIKLLLNLSPPMIHPPPLLATISNMKVQDDYLEYILENIGRKSWKDFDQYLLFLMQKCGKQTAQHFEKGMISEETGFKIFQALYEFYTSYKQKKQLMRNDGKSKSKECRVPEGITFEELYGFWKQKN